MNQANIRPLAATELLTLILQNLKFSNAVLAFSHASLLNAIGGTEKVMRVERDHLADNGVSFLQIYPYQVITSTTDDPPRLFCLNVDMTFIGYVTAEQVNVLLPLLVHAGVRIPWVHVHHLLGIGAAQVMQMIEQIDARLRFFVHDYFSACRQTNLLKDNEVFCHNPPVDSATCGECRFGIYREPHVAATRRLLTKHADSIVAPSEVCRDEWLKTYPEFSDRIRVVPHLKQVAKRPLARSTAREKIRIAYVGYQSHIKGFETWKRMVAEHAGGPYQFFHFGQWNHYEGPITKIPVSILSDPQAMTKALREHEIDFAFLWSITFETFSFTAFESLSAGSLILTNPNSGNIARVVRDTGFGIVLESEADLVGFLKSPQKVREFLSERTGMQYEFSTNPEIAAEIIASIDDRPAYHYPGDAAVEKLTETHAELFRTLCLSTGLTHFILQKLNELADARETIGHLLNEVTPLRNFKASMGYSVARNIKRRVKSLIRPTINDART